jgi:hypothetical protein
MKTVFVLLTLVKSAHQKGFSQKKKFQLSKQFLAKIFLVSFYKNQIYILEISREKTDFFYTPFAICVEKSFHLLEGTKNTF